MEDGMGLDMYLSKKTYVRRWEHIPDGDQYSVTVLKGGDPVSDIKPERVSYVEEQIGQWRKANEIHAWFVRNVQNRRDDCGSYYVGREKLRALLATVKKVLANPKLGKRLLPTKAGFFFGSTEYDEYYLDDLKQTEEIIEAALAEEGGDFYYHSSW